MRTRRSLLLILVLSLGTWGAIAQTVPPALMVSAPEGGVTPLHISALDISARVHGSFAQTSMTMTFFNANARALSGDLYFPLPEGATVSGYALDIEGRMVDGVVVEKARARAVFEKIVRQGIDPGLVEWVRGNSFKTRVFPIPARGTRTVRVDFHTTVLEQSGYQEYRLPLRFAHAVDEVTVRIEVYGDRAPVMSRTAMPGLRFSPWRDAWVAEAQARDVVLDSDLRVELRGDTGFAVTERSSDGSTYFAFTATPPLPPARVEGRPRRITIYWDASRSRLGADLRREIDLVDRWIDAQGPGDLTVDIVLLRDVAEDARTVTLRGGNASPVRLALEAVRYDGGTDLSVLPEPAPGTDFCLLFSDGVSNYGSGESPRAPVPVYVLSSDPVSDHPFLRSIASSSGGAYLNLNVLADNAALEAIGSPVFSLQSIRVDSGKVRDLLPLVPHPVGGSVVVAGKLDSAQATLTVAFGTHGVATHQETYRVTRTDAPDGEVPRIVWAQLRLDQLESNPRRNQALMVSLGREHGLVTPGTSLIVLESLDQYVEHRIAPPQTLPQMRRRYFAAMDARKEDREAFQNDKIEWIASLWRDRVAWWETTFEYPPGFRYEEEQNKEERGGLRDSESVAPEESRLMALAPATAMESDGAGAEESEEDGAEEAVGGQDTGPRITLKPWDPDTPYLERMRSAVPRDRYKVYLQEATEFGRSPAFFLDCGDFFAKEGDPSRAARIWSNIVELELENAALLRILAHRLAQADRLVEAAHLFEEVLRLRPEEPQSYRDLALVRGRMEEYGRAVELLYQVVVRPWDRFQEIELIALTELNALIPRARASGVRITTIDPRLLRLLDVDMRIILTWDADLTDMDLWVTEPSGERAFYGHTRTTIGGTFSLDFTDGYGPEEYMVRRAMAGDYTIQVNYFSSSAPEISGSVTLQVDVFTNFGRPDEERQSLTVRLTESDETIDVGTVRFGPR